MLHDIIAGGRRTTLDIEAITTNQALALASAAAALLMQSGMIAEGVVLTGPHLIQFMGDLGDQLMQRREDALLRALDAAHYHLDASNDEIELAGTTRAATLRHARELRNEIDPIDVREARRARAEDLAG